MQDVEAPAGHGTDVSGRGDFGEGLGWLVLGCAVLVGSLRMDRLQSQGVPPYAAPGLLPGLLGIVIVLFGGLLALRGSRRRGLHAAPAAGGRPSSRQLPVVLALCLIFGLGLVGHGLPFWIPLSSSSRPRSLCCSMGTDRRVSGSRCGRSPTPC
jgi:hypothetical protein